MITNKQMLFLMPFCIVAIIGWTFPKIVNETVTGIAMVIWLFGFMSIVFWNSAKEKHELKEEVIMLRKNCRNDKLNERNSNK